jgi:hypothetical protein
MTRTIIIAVLTLAVLMSEVRAQSRSIYGASGSSSAA